MAGSVRWPTLCTQGYRKCGVERVDDRATEVGVRGLSVCPRFLKLEAVLIGAGADWQIVDLDQINRRPDEARRFACVDEIQRTHVDRGGVATLVRERHPDSLVGLGSVLELGFDPGGLCGLHDVDCGTHL